MTATLSLKYKEPTFANQYLVIRTELVEQKGRKARVKALIENTEGETLVEAECVARFKLGRRAHIRACRG